MNGEQKHDDIPYLPADEIDYSLITIGMKMLPFYEDDIYLGMQAMNVGLSDSVITDLNPSNSKCCWNVTT
jgi:hypothetical protein